MPTTAPSTIVRFRAPEEVYDPVRKLDVHDLVKIPRSSIEQYQGLVSNLEDHASSKTAFELGCLGRPALRHIRCTCAYDQALKIFTIKAA